MDDVATAPPPAFPMPRTCPVDPPPGYAEIAAEQPISKVTLPTGRTAWLILGHDYLRQILADSRVSVNRLDPAYPHLVEMDGQAMGAISLVSRSLVGLDPPEHTVHRRMLINEFTVKKLAAMRPRIQAIVDECIDNLLKQEPPTDLVTALSLPVPSLVICDLLGVPYADHGFFQDRTLVAFNRKSTQLERMQAGAGLLMYMDKLVTEKEAAPSDEDLIGRLITKYREAGNYAHEHLVGLSMLLLMAGFETTANMISLGTLSFIENPDQLAKLTDDGTLATRAVDELLRYLSIVDVSGGSRVAVEDIEIGGVTIRKGDGIIALLSGANRDPGYYPHPDNFDIDRGAKSHVAFGYGIHQCLGQNLARLELEIVYRTLFARVPTLRLAVPVSELPLKDEASIYGLAEMPVSW
ncbi:cytochrome P450 [Plantactinospora sp. KBS50]|nr:cytochrome P450 [Plantactinospora sp. KBS50]